MKRETKAIPKRIKGRITHEDINALSELDFHAAALQEKLATGEFVLNVNLINAINKILRRMT